jgi:hypothetical protein
MCLSWLVLAAEAVVTHREPVGTAEAAEAVQEALRLSRHKRWVSLNIR